MVEIFLIQFSDTDSVFLGLTRTSEFPEDFEKDFHGTWKAAFNAIVKPDMLESWYAKSLNWFVLDQKKESKRKPGNNSLQ